MVNNIVRAEVIRIAYIVSGVGLHAGEVERRQSIPHRLTYRESSVDVITVNEGPYTIESGIEEEYAAVSYLSKLYEIEENYDAFIVGCFGDPGLRVARELISKPVIGPGKASYAIASVIARRFAVLTPLTTTIPITWSQIDAYGYSSRVYDVISLDLKVADIQKKGEDLIRLIVEKVKNVVGFGKAEALVLGCMSMGCFLFDVYLCCSCALRLFMIFSS
ncbi:MAG: aspartate/glutamate racemase family protein [Sulfolobales archaeon]